jgi:DNA-binding transcriptional ArsR family regulator
MTKEKEIIAIKRANTESKKIKKKGKANVEKENRKNLEKKKNKKSTSIMEFDKFLHEPIRLLIMAELMVVEELDMIYLKQNLDLTWGNLSFHSTKLEGKGYITITKQFIGKKPYTLLKITPEGVKKFKIYKKSMFNLLK